MLPDCVANRCQTTSSGVADLKHSEVKPTVEEVQEFCIVERFGILYETALARPVVTNAKTAETMELRSNNKHMKDVKTAITKWIIEQEGNIKVWMKRSQIRQQ